MSKSYRSNSVPVQSLSKKKQEQQQNQEKQKKIQQQQNKKQNQEKDVAQEQKQKREKQQQSQKKVQDVLAELAKLPDVMVRKFPSRRSPGHRETPSRSPLTVRWQVAECPYNLKGPFGRPDHFVGRQGQKIIFTKQFCHYPNGAVPSPGISTQLREAGVSDDVVSGLHTYSESKTYHVVYILV